MRKKIKDTDYLAISARIKAMENGLLTRERMEQVLEARTDEEALKLLQESGYPELHATDPESLDAALSASREETLADLADSVPDPRYIDIFKLKYDYHNVKAILKAGAMGVSPDHMLMDMGRVSTAELKKALQSGELENLTPMVASAAAEARELDNPDSWQQALAVALEGYREPVPGARLRIEQVLKVMLTAWIATRMRQEAESMLAGLG